MAKQINKLVHGGQLQQIAQQYQRPIEQWLDLSTGISPLSYPIPEIPLAIWQRLPETSAALIDAAKGYYQTYNLVATSGSQSIISKLPQLLTSKFDERVTVWLPEIGYKEHEKAWRLQDVIIRHYRTLPSSEQLTQHCIVVVINPNNPTGELFSRSTLQTLLTQIQALNGFLIVDEAFIDVISPSQSIIDLTENKHLFVLRSIGKFFGLAGIRLGFLSANQDWLNKLAELANPWEVNGPAQFITQYALQDNQWQRQQLAQLSQLTAKLSELLQQTFNQVPTGTLLFQTVQLPNAAAVFEQLCQQGIYVRLCDEKNALRFGIPTNEQLPRLTESLELIY